METNADKTTIPHWWLYFYPLLFGLAYSQKALFTYNQNTKFISGLSLAGYRDVAADWMASITDPFPLFSHMLKWQYQFLGLHGGVHTSFLFIVAIYGISGVWLAKNLARHREDRGRVLLVFSLLWLFLHFVKIRYFGWYFFPSGLAEQYLLGDYYQPSCFGALLLTGTAAYISGRSLLAAACFVLVPLFHPTYLLSSALIAALIIILPANRSLGISWRKRGLFLSIVGMLLISYALWSIDSLSSGDPLIREKAHKLLAETRIPHHSLPLEWNLRRTVTFYMIAVTAVCVGRKWFIGQLLLVLLSIVTVTILWAIIAYNPTIAVIAPWRVSAFLAPLSWIILLAAAAEWLTQVIDRQTRFSYSTLQWISISVVILVSLLGIRDVISNYKQKTQSEYYPISHFLAENHKPGNQYLIPLKQENIRLEAGVPVYANWRSHPTKDNEFLEWYKRIELARAIYGQGANQVQKELLEKLKVEQKVTHVIWPKKNGVFPFAQKAQYVYSDNHFSLWDVR